MIDAKHRREILESGEFRALAAEKDRISAVLTVLILGVYFGFIALIAFRKDLLGRRIFGENITLGMPVGVGVILAAWILTGVYVVWANGRYDRLIRDVRKRLGA